MATTQESPASPGYVSEQDKRRFTTVAGILGAVFILVQLFAPMAAMFLVMPVWMVRMEMRSFDLDEVAIVDGEVHVVETSVRGFAGDQDSRLVGFSEDGGKTVTDLGEWRPRLLADGERLWLISSDRVGILEGGKLELQAVVAPLGDIGRPFLYRGQPAVAERHPDGDRVRAWDGAAWVPLAPLPSRDQSCVCDELLADGADLVMLTRDGRTLFSGRVTGAAEETHDWEHVATNVSSWSSFVWDGQPAVAIQTSSAGLRLLRFDEGRWHPRPAPTLSGSHFDVAVLQERTGEPLRLLTQTFPGSLRERLWNGREIVEDRRLEQASPFPVEMSFAMAAAQAAPVLLSVVLALILSSMMRTHRVGSHVFETRRVEYASLTRRALAQIIDGALALLPLGVLGFLWFNRGMERFLEEGPLFALWMLAAMGAALLWGLVVLAGLSLTEGVWGGSPGKWVLGIRVVGTDLRPCGFGRALIRNLLKLVDGFFNFLVGILMVAFTTEWQRIGDLAARTIVIRPYPPSGAVPARSRSAPMP